MKQTQVTPLIQHPNGDTLTPESIRADVQAAVSGGFGWNGLAFTAGTVQAMLNTINDLAARVEQLEREKAGLVNALRRAIDELKSVAESSGFTPEDDEYRESAIPEGEALLSRMEASK
jgi:hypothetical protein